jgi:hypothetical protein
MMILSIKSNLEIRKSTFVIVKKEKRKRVVYLEPDSFWPTVCSKFIEGFRDDETSCSKHGP